VCVCRNGKVEGRASGGGKGVSQGEVGSGAGVVTMGEGRERLGLAKDGEEEASFDKIISPIRTT
jgi:hypothetical protein